ncbi:MAG TPA: LamG domain-containing protein [Phnomibacter sp.]|nr:LamG domain-containing protein [Phnomibacter sp.]
MYLYKNIHLLSGAMLFAGSMALFTACKKDGNPNRLPPVDPSQYEGTIDGYRSSDEVFPQNLMAHWSFDDNANEKLTNTAPTTTQGNTLVDGGVRGRALSLNNGFLYYATQFPKFNSDTLRSFSISVWIKILNNGTRRTMLMQMARPNSFWGNINFNLNTQAFPASNTTTFRFQPTFMTQTGGLQDNLNSVLSPTIGMDKWTHLVITYDITTGTFHNYADGVRVGNFPNRGLVNTFFCHQPNEFIIGSNYNGIPGKAVNTDVTFAPMTGQVDEIRIWNRNLPDAFVMALYNLGKAGQ